MDRFHLVKIARVFRVVLSSSFSGASACNKRLCGASKYVYDLSNSTGMATRVVCVTHLENGDLDLFCDDSCCGKTSLSFFFHVMHACTYGLLRGGNAFSSVFPET